jgi:hypothetical protein
MAERIDETLQRVSYNLEPSEVRRRILADLTDDLGHIFNDSTVVTLHANGACTVTTEFPVNYNTKEPS